jgi:hypothetical protein
MNVEEDLQRKIMDHALRRRRTVSGAKVKQCRAEWMESYWEAGWNLKECAQWAKLVLEGSIKVSKKQAIHYYGIVGIVKKLAEVRQAGGEEERMEGKWCRVISSVWIREWRKKEELSRQGSMKMLMQEGEVEDWCRGWMRNLRKKQLRMWWDWWCAYKVGSGGGSQGGVY